MRCKSQHAGCSWSSTVWHFLLFLSFRLPIHLPLSVTGQIELYTHIPLVKQLVDKLQQWNFRLCSVFLLDSQFVVSASKYIAGVMTALSSMVSLELPHVNLLTKIDLLDKKSRKEVDEKWDICDGKMCVS